MQMYVTAKHVTGPSKIPHDQVEGRGVVTNTTSCFAYRGPGKEVLSFSAQAG